MPVFSCGPPRVTADFFLAVWPGRFFSWLVGGGIFGVPPKLWVALPCLPRTKDETQVHWKRFQVISPTNAHKKSTYWSYKCIFLPCSSPSWGLSTPKKLRVVNSNKLKSYQELTNFLPKLRHLIPIEKIGSQNSHHNSPWLRSSKLAHFGLPNLKHPVDYSCAPAVTGVWPENPQWLSMVWIIIEKGENLFLSPKFDIPEISNFKTSREKWKSGPEKFSQ